jgi:hypothetical protein
MRGALLLIPLTLALVACARAPAPDWVRIAASPSVAVTMEPCLYELPGVPEFFVHVRIANATSRDFGVDLAHSAFLPNQWGASDTEYRKVIIGLRAVLPPLDEAAKTRLVEDYRAGHLARLVSGASLDYYTAFHASSRAEVDLRARATRFVLVVMDGQLLVTDGADVTEQVRPPEDLLGAREVAVPAPVAWRTVPVGAFVVP